jgi:hypothetical protein
MLTPWLKEEIVREHGRLCFVVKRLSALEAANKATLRAATPGSAEAKMRQLLGRSRNSRRVRQGIGERNRRLS